MYVSGRRPGIIQESFSDLLISLLRLVEFPLRDFVASKSFDVGYLIGGQKHFSQHHFVSVQ